MDKDWGAYAFHVTILKICAKALMSSMFLDKAQAIRIKICEVQFFIRFCRLFKI